MVNRVRSSSALLASASAQQHAAAAAAATVVVAQQAPLAPPPPPAPTATARKWKLTDIIGKEHGLVTGAPTALDGARS